MKREPRFRLSEDALSRFKWICRLRCKVSVEKYISWKIHFYEEDGGAYTRYPQKGDYEGKTFEESVARAWDKAGIESLVNNVLALQSDEVDYRRLNYPEESDAELGIVGVIKDLT